MNRRLRDLWLVYPVANEYKYHVSLEIKKCSNITKLHCYYLLSSFWVFFYKPTIGNLQSILWTSRRAIPKVIMSDRLRVSGVGEPRPLVLTGSIDEQAINRQVKFVRLGVYGKWWKAAYMHWSTRYARHILQWSSGRISVIFYQFMVLLSIKLAETPPSGLYYKWQQK